MLRSTLQLRPGLSMNKVALDWGQPKLFYVKPIPTPWIILFLEALLRGHFLVRNIFWKKILKTDNFVLLVWFSSPIQLSWEEIQLTQNLGS